MKLLLAFIMAVDLLARITLPGMPKIPTLPNIPTIPNLPHSVPIPPLTSVPPDSIVVQPKSQLAVVPELDDFEPARFASLADLSRDADGGIALVPGAFELVDQSFCLRAGGHGPSAASAYGVGALSGSRASYVRDVLLHWRAHREITQGDVQLLLWGITSQVKIGDEPEHLQSVARALLSSEQIDALNGGALGQLGDLLSRSGVGLPAPVQQILTAEDQVRNLLTHGNSSYQQIAAVAVRPAQAEDASARKRWSYDPHGFFIRYLPSSYSTTQIQIFVPPAYTIAHDGNGRVTSIDDGAGSRLDLTYASNVRMLLSMRPPYYGFGNRRQHVALGATALEPVGDVAGNKDLRYVDAIAKAADRLIVASNAPFLDRDGARTFVRGAVPALVCRSLGGCNGTRVASLSIVALGSAEGTYDPAANMGSPANAANQPLAQSGQPTSSDKNKDCDRVRQQLEFAQKYQLRYNDKNVNDAAASGNWSGDYYEERIEKQAWDDNAFGSRGQSEGPGRQGGYTDTETCVATYPTQAQVIADGLPPIMYDVIKNHEMKHVEDCLKLKADHGKDTWQWRRRTEIDAYYISIQTMEQWIAKNC